MMKNVILTIGLVWCGLFLTAQVKSLELAGQAFEKRDYLSAIKHYNKALRKTNDFNAQQQIAGQIALAYYAMNDYQAAAKWFEDAVGDRHDDVNMGIMFANALAADKKYAEAHDVLMRLKSKNPDSKDVTQRLAALQLIINSDKGDTLGIVSEVPHINSVASDYGVAFWDNKLVFASMRRTSSSERVDGRTGQGFSDLFYTQTDSPENNEWAAPKSMPDVFRSPNNDGTFAFDHVHRKAYWTSCTRKPENCLIYQADFNAITGKWSRGEKVGFMNEGYNYGHPFVADHGNTLYFTSNMPGGYGQNDLWKITRKEGGYWGIPVNLGKEINTAANELFPTLSGDSLLFFASDRINSLGGLDVYVSQRDKLFFTTPVNIGYPINSAADDFSLLPDKDGKGGFFCSNRNPETSDDILRYKGFPLKVLIYGTIIRESDKKPLADAKVLFQNNHNQLDSVFTDAAGAYQIQADAFNEYRLSASYDNYYVEKKVVKTNDINLLSQANPAFQANFILSKTAFPCAISGWITNRETSFPMHGVRVEITNDAGFSSFTRSDQQGYYIFKGLKPQTVYAVKTGKEGYFAESRNCILPKVDAEMVFNKSNGYDMDFQLLKIQTREEVVLNNIYYDYNKANLREVSKIELDKLASMLRETPGVAIQINAHTDARGRDEYNMDLSVERAASVVQYLVASGISPDRLIAKGWGESQLLIPFAQTEEEHQANRRTTFNVIRLGDTVLADETDGVDIILPDGEQPTGLQYRVQLLTSSEVIDVNKEFAIVLANLQPIRIYQNREGVFVKYEAGSRATLAEISKLKKQLKHFGYDDCFVVCYFNDQRITLDQAKKMEKEGKR